MVQNIQVLRCFAALAVVVRHLLMWFGTDPGFGLLYVGRAGVDVFFVISGFIMFHTTQNQDRTTAQFWTDRVIRVAPLYWFMTLLIVALFVMGLPAGDMTRLDGNDVPLALAFIPNLRGDGDWNPILAPGWTLIFEMYFYALFGLTFFLRSQVKQLIVLTVFFIAVWLFSTKIWVNFTIYRWFQPITLEFAAGGLLAILLRRPLLLPAAKARICGYALLVIGVIGCFAAAWAKGADTAEPTAIRALLYGPPSVMIVAGALMLEKSGVVWRSRTLLLLGAASYSIYLGHMLVIQYASIVWRDLGPTIPWLMPVFYAASYVASVLFGVVLYFAFEKPVHALLKGVQRRRMASRPRRAAPSTDSAPA